MADTPYTHVFIKPDNFDELAEKAAITCEVKFTYRGAEYNSWFLQEEIDLEDFANKMDRCKRFLSSTLGHLQTTELYNRDWPKMGKDQ